MGSRVQITINRSRISARINAGINKMIPAVAEQALADCNYFARRDQGTMIESSETASDLQRASWCGIPLTLDGFITPAHRQQTLTPTRR